MPVISTDLQRQHTYRAVSDWSETLRFRRSPGEAGFDVLAIVSRVDVQSLPEQGVIGGAAFQVMIVHEAATYDVNAEDGGREYSGLNIADLRDGVSTLDIARRPREAAKSRTIRVLDDSDAAVLHLECR